MRRFVDRRLAIVLVLVVAAGACEGAPPQRSGRPPVPVEVAVVEPWPIPRTLSAVGSIESPEGAVIAAEVPGVVESVDISEGAPVEAGHAIVRIDDDAFRAAVQIARARHRNAEAQIRRMRRLRERGVASEQELDDAEAELDAAAGALEEARVRLRKAVVRAPFDGILGLRQVNPGDYLEVGTPVVRITRTEPLELVFGLPQRHAADITVGQDVRGTVGRCGHRFRGQTTAIDPQVDERTRTIPVQARIANPDGRLRPGMSARVRVHVGSIPEALVIPREAVVRRGTKHFVYTLDERDTARQQEVELGEMFVDGVHIRKGLTAGARVVTAGHQKLGPGAATRPTPYGPKQNPHLELGWTGPPDCGPGAERAFGGTP